MVCRSKGYIRVRALLLRRAVRISLICVMFWCVKLPAAAPGNDLCAGALEIPPAGPFPYFTPPVNVRDATTNADPVLPPVGVCRSGSVSRSVWYRFTPGANANYTISTCTDTITTLQDTVMAIYTTSEPCAVFLLFECGDDECGIRSAIAADLDAGTTYYIVVWNSGNITPATNAATVQLRVSPPPPVTNDICAGTIVVPGAGPFPYVTPLADTRLAGKAGDPPAPDCGTMLDRSLWYQFTPASSGAYNLSIALDSG